MKNNRMELNAEELEMVNGGSLKQALSEGVFRMDTGIRAFANSWDEPVSFAVGAPFVVVGSYIKGFVSGLFGD